MQLLSEPGGGSDVAGALPPPCATATSGCSTARRSGPRVPGGRTGACAWPAPIGTSPSTAASRCSPALAPARHRDPPDRDAERLPGFLPGVPHRRPRPRRRPDRRGRRRLDRGRAVDVPRAACSSPHWSPFPQRQQRPSPPPPTAPWLAPPVGWTTRAHRSSSEKPACSTSWPGCCRSASAVACAPGPCRPAAAIPRLFKGTASARTRTISFETGRDDGWVWTAGDGVLAGRGIDFLMRQPAASGGGRPRWPAT